jgi:hypothetical protein
MLRSFGVVALVLGLAVLSIAPGGAPVQTAAATKTRVGVFDSRAIAFAYARSDEGMAAIRRLQQDYAAAKAANDTARITELEQEGPWQQVRLHQQVFSTATAASIVEKIADKLPAIAREANVTVIVSKWEVPYKDASVELVDVTMPMAKLFNPDEKLLKGIEQLVAQPPVPFEKLSLDPRM